MAKASTKAAPAAPTKPVPIPLPTESPPTDDLITQSQSFGRFCYVLGDHNGNKMKILGIIARHDLSVKSVSTLLGLSESSTSQHLSRLQAHGVISGQRDGHQTIYKINPEFLTKFTSTFNVVLPQESNLT